MSQLKQSHHLSNFVHHSNISSQSFIVQCRRIRMRSKTGWASCNSVSRRKSQSKRLRSNRTSFYNRNHLHYHLHLTR